MAQALDPTALVGGATPYGWATLGVQALKGGVMGGTPAGPSSADAYFGGSVFGFDNSGWTVATGSARSTATAGDRGGLTGSGALGGAGAGSNITWPAVAAIGLIALAVIWKHRKS